MQRTRADAKVSASEESHYQLIAKARTLDYKTLESEVKKLPPLPPVDSTYVLPEKERKNLFTEILLNKKLLDNDKVTLIGILLKIPCYYKNAMRLLESDILYALPTKDTNHLQFLISVYEIYLGLENKKNSPLLNEEAVWKLLVETNEIAKKTYEMIEKHDKSKTFPFAKFWLDRIATPQEVIRVVRQIHISNAHSPLWHLHSVFIKMGKQRIIKLRFDEFSSTTKHLILETEKQDIARFMGQHRVSYFFTCPDTKSEKIYKELDKLTIPGTDIIGKIDAERNQLETEIKKASLAF